MKLQYNIDGWKRAIEGGEKRQGNHHPSDRESLRTQVNSNHEHVLGYIGERAFEHLSGLQMDRELRRGGDNLIDFSFGGGGTIDVKTRAQRHYDMPIKTHQLRRSSSHLYIHAYVIMEERTVVFHGFIDGMRAGARDPKPAFNADMAARGVANYLISPDESAQRPLEELLDIIRMLQ